MSVRIQGSANRSRARVPRCSRRVRAPEIVPPYAIASPRGARCAVSRRRSDAPSSNTSRGSMRSVRSTLLALALAVGAVRPGAAAAQGNDPYFRAQELEEKNKYPEAAAAYREALAQSPASLPALLGLERVYAQLGRSDSFLPVVEKAIAAQPRAAALRAAELRTLRSLGDRDRVRAAFERWH